jgi:hypothetical protein
VTPGSQPAEESLSTDKETDMVADRLFWNDRSALSSPLIITHSRLAIGLWAIRKGMVKGAVSPKLVSRIPDPQ